MSRVERVESLLSQIEDETRMAFDEHTQLYHKAQSLESENAKLRELVRDMRKALFTLNIDHCQACPRDTINGPCTKFLVWGSDECSFEEDMRELRIEANE